MQQKRYVVPFRGSSFFVFFIVCVCVYVRLQILFSAFEVKSLEQEMLRADHLRTVKLAFFPCRKYLSYVDQEPPT